MATPHCVAAPTLEVRAGPDRAWLLRPDCSSVGVDSAASRDGMNGQ